MANVYCSRVRMERESFPGKDGERESFPGRGGERESFPGRDGERERVVPG